MASAPIQRSGGASGMIGTARLLGQTLGATLVALLFSFAMHDKGTTVCLWAGAIFAFNSRCRELFPASLSKCP